MALMRVQVVFPFFTNLPTDVFVNQFHFDALNVTHAQAADEIQDRLLVFYNAVYGTASNRVSYILWSLAQVKVFNLDDSVPRVPEVRDLGMTGDGLTSSSIPTEVAMVFSFHAEPESGVRFQRLYNRIYLGGVAPAWITGSTTSAFPRFSGDQVGVVQGAAELLWDLNDIDVRWKQVSNAGGSTVSREIVGGWIDNSPDTQRRRSVLASERGVWTPTP